MSSGDDRQQMATVLALVSTVSQIGCTTVAIVVGALLVGLWLDGVFDTRPLFTVLFLLGSIPVSFYILVRIALSIAAKFAPSSPEETGDKSSKEV
jgi:F0F1-type ATP synthase assembly protein I